MTAINEREAKPQYRQGERGAICAYSLKVASTYIRAHLTKKLGQAAAVAARKNGYDVHLIVRHPLDRLVSNWSYWTKKANNFIKDIWDTDPDDHNVILGCNQYKNQIGLERWYRTATKYYNSHWYSQADYHTVDGEFIPNVLWPKESLKFMPATADENILNRSPRDKPSWEDYFSDSFRAECEDYYAQDMELYEKSKEMWDGCSYPAILRGFK